MSEQSRSLVKRSDAETDMNRSLALLANLQSQQTVGGLIRATLYDGSVAPSTTGPALANDDLLTGVLREAAVYKFTPGVSPQTDFVAVTTAATAQETLVSLRRLESAFTEVRGALAVKLGMMMQQVSADGNLEAQGELKVLRETFLRVNGSFILVINSLHSLLEASELDRQVLTPQFVRLLKSDPYLKELAPGFEGMQVATTSDAKRMALRRFFEIFKAEVLKPTKYDEQFGALAQSMLLRELRFIIASESKLPAAKRALAPYLANLFESSIRAELKVATAEVGGEQPILTAFRDCAQEAGQLMESTLRYLLESSEGAARSFSIERPNVIACEVMLSAGCILPELHMAEKVVDHLIHVPDMNPALVLVLISALKFSVLSSGPHLSVEPGYLTRRGLEIAGELTEPDQERLLDEVLLPLVRDMIASCSENLELWGSLPNVVREKIIERVLVRSISKGADSPLEQDPFRDQGMRLLLLKHLEPQKSPTANIHPIALRWLFEQAGEGEIEDVWCGKLSRMVLGQSNLATRAGIDPLLQEKVRKRAAASMLEFLASNRPHTALFVDQVLALGAVNVQTEETVRRLAIKTILAPLAEALKRYDTALTAATQADLDALAAQEQAQERQGRVTEARLLRGWISELQRQLDDLESYLEAMEKIATVEERVSRLEGKLSEVEGLSVKALRERQLPADHVASLERKIASEKDALEVIKSKRFPVDPSVESLKGFDRRSVTMNELADMELRARGLAEFASSQKETVTVATTSLTGAVTAVKSLRDEVDRMFQLAMRIMNSTILHTLPPSALEFPLQGAGARLGLVVRLALQGRTIEKLAEPQKGKMIRSLEADARDGLQAAITRFTDVDDTLLMLHELVRLNKTGATLFQNWPEAASVTDTTVAYTITAIPPGVSLAEYLYQRLRADLNNPEATWLTNEPGWSEAFHGPLITLFANTLERNDVGMPLKRRALKAVFFGVAYWVKRHQEHDKIIEEAAQRGDTNPITPPQVTCETLLMAWKEFLRTSQARSEQFKTAIPEIHQYLVQYARRALGSANANQMAALYIPFAKVLRSCAADSQSALYQASSLLAELEQAIVARRGVLEFQAAKEKADAEKELQKSQPQPVVSQGIGFDELTQRQGGLALPAPKAPLSVAARLGFNERSSE